MNYYCRGCRQIYLQSYDKKLYLHPAKAQSEYNNTFKTLDKKINTVEKKQNYFMAIAGAIVGVIVFFKNTINMIISDIVGGIK